MTQIADRVEAPCEREQLKRKEKKKRKPVEPDHHRPRGREFKAVFDALIHQQRAQRKNQPAEERGCIDQIGRNIEPAAVANPRGQNEVQSVQEQAADKQRDHLELFPFGAARSIHSIIASGFARSRSSFTNSGLRKRNASRASNSKCCLGVRLSSRNSV